jgi:hypothetical protein
MVSARGSLLIVVAASALAVALAATSACGGSKKKGHAEPGTPALTTGTYRSTDYVSVSDGCVTNFNPAPLTNLRLYISTAGEASGNPTPFAVDGFFVRLDGLATGTSLAANATFPYFHQLPGAVPRGGLFCEESDTDTWSATVTSADQLDVTFTQTFSYASGNQCDRAMNGVPLPCTSVETFHLHRSGPATPADAPPARVVTTGTAAAFSDVAPLTNALHGTGSGLSIHYGATIGGVAVADSNQGWVCGNIDVAHGIDNFQIIDLKTGFYMLVATNQWAVGAHTLGPDTAFVAIIAPDRFGNSISGTLTLDAAGTVEDVPGNDCQFHLDGLQLSGTAVPAP